MEENNDAENHVLSLEKSSSKPHLSKNDLIFSPAFKPPNRPAPKPTLIGSKENIQTTNICKSPVSFLLSPIDDQVVCDVVTLSKHETNETIPLKAPFLFATKKKSSLKGLDRFDDSELIG
jgi:hypothetical protein